LSVKNPNQKDLAVLREPEVILEEMESLDAEAAEVLETIRGLV
jgi:type I restriction enzyme M protein